MLHTVKQFHFKFIVFNRVLILALLLSACSTKLTYDYLDWIIPWYIADYVTLNDEQKYLLDNALDKSLLWHRTTQIPAYTQLLNKINGDLNQPISYKQVASYYHSYKILWNHLVLRLTPDITKMLQSASDAQIVEFFENLQIQNEELREEYLLPTKSQMIRKRSDKSTKRIEGWLGYLTAEQKQAIFKWSNDLQPVNDKWMYHRLIWQQNFKHALLQRNDPKQFELLIYTLFIQPDQYWSVEYRQAIHYNEHVTINFFYNLLKSLSQKQRAVLRSKIDAIIAQFQDIAQKS